MEWMKAGFRGRAETSRTDQQSPRRQGEPNVQTDIAPMTTRPKRSMNTDKEMAKFQEIGTESPTIAQQNLFHKDSIISSPSALLPDSTIMVGPVIEPSKPINVEAENQGNEPQWHHQIDSDFSNSIVTPTDGVISSNLFEVVVMDEDTRDLTGKQGEHISPPGFEGLEIGFKVGCGNVQGNKNTSKGRPKRSDNQDKGVSLSLYSPKKVESMEGSTIGSLKTMRNWKRLTTRSQILINGSIVDMELGNKRKQAENLIKEATGVMRKKKHRIVENEQGVVPTMGLMEVAGQQCRV